MSQRLQVLKQKVFYDSLECAVIIYNTMMHVTYGKDGN